MQFIYVIGAQCTGKTTLVEAIADWLKQNMPHVSVGVVQETARSTLRKHHFDRVDVRSGGAKCLQLQKLILQYQAEKERDMKLQNVNVVVSDRSGVDPFIYARMYCGTDDVEEMMQSDDWTSLRCNTREGIVVLCEPVAEWLVDDGVRLTPLNWEEWKSTHELFCTFLTDQQLKYTVLPASVVQIQERLKFVLSLCKFANVQARY